MTKISKKIRLYKKMLSNKKLQIAGRPKKPNDNEFNIQMNYNGPLITENIWRQFSNEMRMGTGFNLTKTISTILNDPYLTVCQSKAIIRVIPNPEINLSLMQNSIMISCDKEIPHYYAFKPHVINLIRAVIMRGEYDNTLNARVPLEGDVELFIKNGDVLERDIISNEA